jgi:hypothetical protein
MLAHQQALSASNAGTTAERKQLAASNAGTPASTVSQQRWHNNRTYTKDAKLTAGSKHTVPHIFSPILFK